VCESVAYPFSRRAVRTSHPSEREAWITLASDNAPQPRKSTD